MNKKTWFITREQIAACDIDDAIQSVDPEKIADENIFRLHGAVRLRIEFANGPADIFTSQQSRKFFRRLHQRWPWAGYFLQLNPVSKDSPIEQIIDLGTFMGIALCHVDKLTYFATPHGTVLRYNGDQLCKILAEFQGRAAELARAVDMTPTCICQRDDLISSAVISFFETGQALNQQTKRNRKKTK
jgi:hypothetical protein